MNDDPAAPLEIVELRKAFADVVAVDGVDLTLGNGEIIALVGPSGCGKSTLLRMIAGLTAADSGSIHLDGTLVEDGRSRLAPERRSAGLVFQEHALFPHLTVEENVGFGLRSRDKAGRRRQVEEMLMLVDLAGFDSRYPHELSGGERQRVALARALAPEPAIMLFDEPFASLDHNLRVQLRQEVLRVLRETKTPAVFVTHDQREALGLGDRIVVMQDGRVIQNGSPAEIFHTPVSRFVGEFMGEASFLALNAEQATLLGPVTPVATQTSVAQCAMVRPDDVQFSSSLDGEFTVVRAEYSGSAWLVTARGNRGETVAFAASHLDQPVVGERGSISLVPGHEQVLVEGSADVD